MWKLKDIEQYRDSSRLVEDLSIILEGHVSPLDIQSTVVNELFGIGRMLRRLFVNPRVKKQIRRLSDDLVKIRVEQAKETLNMDHDEFKGYHEKGSKNTRGKDKKMQILDDQLKAIESKMDLLAKNDERLQKYLEMHKLEARMKANELIIKMADQFQKRILSSANKDLKNQGKKLEIELKKEK